MTHTDNLQNDYQLLCKVFLINNYLSKLKALFHLTHLKKEIKGFTQNLGLSSVG